MPFTFTSVSASFHAYDDYWIWSYIDNFDIQQLDDIFVFFENEREYHEHI
jgi:hypothetical protein